MATSRVNLAAATAALTAALASVAIWAQSTQGSSLLPHAFCITGSPPLMVLHVVADSVIALAYLLIPLALLNIIRQRNDIPFGWVAWLFGAFILACGATHAVEVWTLWDPVYWYAGVLKAFTGAVSLGTAWVLYRLTPSILAIPSAGALRASNAQLQAEVKARREAEHALLQTQTELQALLARTSAQAHEAEAGRDEALKAAQAAREATEQLNRELELRVEKRTGELRTLLQDMESFSSSIAHDLRAPLTTLSGFSQVLLNTEKERLSARGQGYLGKVVAAAARMDEIITALLDIARLPHEPLRRVRVDLAQLARAILGDLQAADPQRRAALHIPQTLPVVGDPVLLRQVMVNLLGNSWKFSAREDVVRIELGTAATPRGEAVVVRDHGAGFDASRPEYLFQMFHRMHSLQEFGGSGVGLAIVKRIVQRHGGDVWAESAPGAGATFYFTLAAA